MGATPEYQTFPPPHMLSDRFRIFRKNTAGKDLIRLAALFPKPLKTYVMGGFIRDLLIEHVRGTPIEPADYDLVIGGLVSRQELQDKLGCAYIAPNDFGGAKCQIQEDHPIFDIWRIEDHTNMSSAPKPHTIEQLLRHNLLDIDAALWDLSTDFLHDCGCLKAIRAGSIDLMGNDEGISSAFLAPQAAHILAVAFKTAFALSDRASDFVRAVCESGKRADVLRICSRKLTAGSATMECLVENLLNGVHRS